MALGHLVMGIPHDRGAVDVGRYLPAKGLVEQIIFGSAAEIFAAPDHVGDTHKVVVDNIGKVIGGQAIPLDKDLVVQGVVVHGDVAEDGVVEGGGTGGGDLLPDHIGLSGGYTGLGYVGVQVAAGIGGTVEVAAVLLALGFFAEAVVRVAFLHQKLCIAAIGVPALGLDVGGHGTAYVGAFVVGKAALRHGAVDHISSAFHQTPLIGILNAQNKGAAGIAGDKPGVQGSAEIAHVHIAGGGGGKAGADLSVGDLCLHLREICHIKSHTIYPP